MMRLTHYLTGILLLITCIGHAHAQSTLVTYPAPEGAELNADFTIRVRTAGGEWQDVDTYLVQVDEVRGTKHCAENASMAYFDMSGEVEVNVTYNRDTLRTAKVRPSSCGINPTIEGRTINFRLNRPRNLSVEVNGDIFHNLHLFANPLDETKPKKTSAKGLIYFPPGMHKIPGDTLRVSSDTKVYVAGGAVIDGCIYIEEAQNVRVTGRGIVRPHRKAGVSIANSKNVTVEGIITSQCPTGGSDSVLIRNVKSISHYGWGDGMNVFASNNVEFDGVFCRNSDDCTTVYGTRKGFTGGCSNITMRHSVLWADVAHPIFIGLHGDVDSPETLENLSYIDIDILDHREQQVDYQGCLAINAGDENLVRNVRFEDIRIEDFRQGQLVNLRIFFNKKYCRAPGRGIENVLFKNISYEGTHSELSIIAGYDMDRQVKDIRFEHLRINGTLIYDDMPDKPKWYKTADMARFFIGEHVEGVTFAE